MEGLIRFFAGALLLAAPPALFAGASSVPDQTRLRAEHRDLLRAVRGGGPTDPYIVINTQDNLLLLRTPDRILRQSACATGSGRRLEGPKRWKHRWVFDTPTGRYSIMRKVQDPLWTKPEWAFVEGGEEIPVFAEDPRRFQRGVLGRYALYFAKDFMIHGTLYEINLGKSITHGCVRVGESDLQYLHDRVQTGCPVYIY